MTINALNEEHLRRILLDYVKYHHEDRLNDSLGRDTPNRRIVKQRPGVNAKVASIAWLGGLHHRYTWARRPNRRHCFNPHSRSLPTEPHTESADRWLCRSPTAGQTSRLDEM